MNGTTALPRGRGAFRQATTYAVGLALSKSTGLLLLPLVTHALSPEDYGRLEFLTSFVIAGTLISSTWLVETLFRFAAAAPPDGPRAAAEVTGLGLVIAGAILVLTVAAAPLLAAWLPVRASTGEIMFAGAIIAAEALNSIPLGWLRMQDRARRWAVLMTGRMVAHLALAAVLLWGGFGVAGVLAAGAIASAAAGAILVGAQMREGGLSFSPRAWRPLIAYGTPLTVNGLATFALNSADLWFLAGAVSSAALGLYALALKIAIIAHIATQPFDLWWSPRRLAVLGEPNGFAKSARLAGFGAALALVSAAGTAVAGPVLVRALTPEAYHAATTLLPWMVGALAIQALAVQVNVGCYVGARGTLAGAVNLGAAAVVLLLYALLIPPYGLAGAIAATLIAQTLRMAWFGVLSLRRAAIPYPFRAIALLAAACVGTAMVPQLVPSPAWGTLAGLAALGGCLALAGALGLTPSGKRPFGRGVQAA